MDKIKKIFSYFLLPTVISIISLFIFSSTIFATTISIDPPNPTYGQKVKVIIGGGLPPKASSTAPLHVEVYDDKDKHIDHKRQRCGGLKPNNDCILDHGDKLKMPSTGNSASIIACKETIKSCKEPRAEVVATLNVTLAGGDDGSGKNPCPGGVCKTALGDIPTNPTAFAGRILSIGIGLAGGIALILMVIGSIRILTSSGDQQKLAGGRDMIVAAVAGLLFLIFSVLILRFVGIEILGL